MRGTVLQCVKQASAELGLPMPVSVQASQEAQPQQMFALLNACGNELCTMHEWQFLRKSAFITLVDGQAAYPLPKDFVKLINETLWEKSKIDGVVGPMTPRQWAYLTNSVTVAPNYCFIIKNDSFEFAPTPGANGTGTGIINYEFMSNGWVQDHTDLNLYKAVATNDNDKLLFDFWLMVKFLKLKTWQAKGLDTVTLRDDFARTLTDVMGQDHAAPILGMVHGRMGLPPPVPPETGFGS